MQWAYLSRPFSLVAEEVSKCIAIFYFIEYFSFFFLFLCIIHSQMSEENSSLHGGVRRSQRARNSPKKLQEGDFSTAVLVRSVKKRGKVRSKIRSYIIYLVGFLLLYLINSYFIILFFIFIFFWFYFILYYCLICYLYFIFIKEAYETK